jgi:hypothetical protein
MSQIFKKNISINTLFEFLEKINCHKTEHFYTVDVVCYKRSIYLDILKPFLNELKQYYHFSKYKYIDPENMNHNKFNTIIRQICKYTNTIFIKKIKHDQSKYSVIFHIYYSTPPPVNS